MPSNEFDPAIHLAPLVSPPQHITLGELGFEPTIYSSIAASHVFPLFTLEAVKRIRAEAVDRDTLATHMYSDNNSPCVVRGHCPDRAPFTYNAWTHPEVAKRINEMAGLPITPVYNYEIGHTNLQLGPGGWAALKAEPDKFNPDQEVASAEEISPTLFRGLNWHKDSYPFVCILMLSDMSPTGGGNTVVRKADGSLHVCDLPPIGHAMILQGGRLDHAVSPTNTTEERITMVTSYRPVDPMAPDTCVLRTVRAVSDLPTLEKQWIGYRMRVLAERAELFAAKVDKGRTAEQMAQFAAEQTAFLTESWSQMVTPVARVSTDTRTHYLEWLNTQNNVAVVA